MDYSAAFGGSDEPHAQCLGARPQDLAWRNRERGVVACGAALDNISTFLCTRISGYTNGSAIQSEIQWSSRQRHVSTYVT